MSKPKYSKEIVREFMSDNDAFLEKPDTKSLSLFGLYADVAFEIWLNREEYTWLPEHFHISDGYWMDARSDIVEILAKRGLKKLEEK